eukprot:759488-Hanusia_phi.AAC.3
MERDREEEEEKERNRQEGRMGKRVGLVSRRVRDEEEEEEYVDDALEKARGEGGKEKGWGEEVGIG